MKQSIRILVISLLLNFVFQNISSQEIEIKVIAPPNAHLGEQFCVKYIVNNTVTVLKLSDYSSDFKLKSGPSTSFSNSVSKLNGVVTGKNETTFIYTLESLHEGDLPLPFATTSIDSINYSSNAHRIKILPKDLVNKSGAVNDSCFAKFTFSTTEAYKQEPIIAQLKIYSLSDCKSIDKLKMPGLDGFLQYDITPNPNMAEINNEVINGVAYNSVELKRLILIPLKPGDFSLGQSTIVCNIVKTQKKNKQNTLNDIFDSETISAISLSTNSTLVHIKDFPTKKPRNFSYISGKALKINTSIRDSIIYANKPFQLKIEISGKTNLKFLESPKTKLPSQFEVIDIKTLNKVEEDKEGIRGTKTFLYIIRAKSAGIFKIPASSFCYFDLETKKYHKISSDTLTVNVAKPNSITNIQNYIYPIVNVNTAIKEAESAKMIVIDLSASMLAQDFIPNRQTAVINGLIKYIENTDNQTGIIAFSSIPRIINPISDDKKTIQDSLRNITAKNLGDNTSIGLALVKAIDALNQSSARNKAIILITDGNNNAGSINDKLAVEIARHFNIQTNIIGVSSNAESAHYIIKTNYGDLPTTLPIDINDQELSQAAKSTNGEYFRVTTINELESALRKIETHKNGETIKDFKPVYSKTELQCLIDLMKQEVSEEVLKIELSEK